MKTKQKRIIRLVMASVLAATAMGVTAQADDYNALINKLVDKGILTTDEAEEIDAELKTEEDNLPKFETNDSVKTFQFFGDARIRYEFRKGQDPTSDTMSRQRFRYRLRLGVKGEYKDDFYYGVRLETSDSPRSTNVTIGDDAGPFGKGSDGINVGRVYLGWHAADWLTLEAGRMANPLETSSMVWDGDLNPEGLSERFKYSNDNYELFGTFGQFVYDDANPENPFGAGALDGDAFLLAWQVGGAYKFNDEMSLRIAPIVYNYTGQGDNVPGFNSAFTPAGNFSGINDLLVVEVPVEYNFKVANLPMKAFADFAINTQAGKRRDAAIAAGGVPAGTDREGIAYQAGLSMGKLNNKGSWEGKAYWQHAELFSLDPNLIDSDLFDSKLNLEGFVVKFGYAVTDNISANVTYANADRINKSIGTGGAGDIKTSNMNDFQLLQLDMKWKF
ncbi:MAG: putative porin [Verrucomicrobia bacterium]|nr:putative porin [Verrucomicrobiota bacterium]MCF7708383.1 putative porin [Verrucomicrobiota bacterium]